MDGVDVRFDLRPLEEVVAADEGDPPVGHDFGLAVGHDVVRQRFDLAAVGAQAEEAPRRVAVILVAAARAAGGEGDAAVGQDRRIVVVPRAGGQPLQTRAIGGDAEELEELLAGRNHREDDLLAVVGARRRGDQALAGIDQQPRLDARSGRRQRRRACGRKGPGRACRIRRTPGCRGCPIWSAGQASNDPRHGRRRTPRRPATRSPRAGSVNWSALLGRCARACCGRRPAAWDRSTRQARRANPTAARPCGKSLRPASTCCRRGRARASSSWPRPCSASPCRW